MIWATKVQDAAASSSTDGLLEWPDQTVSVVWSGCKKEDVFCWSNVPFGVFLKCNFQNRPNKNISAGLRLRCDQLSERLSVFPQKVFRTHGEVS